MSVKVQTIVSEARVGNSTKKLIMLLLADRANDDGVCWPSLETIAFAAELSVECVCRNITQLVKAGFLRKSKRSGSGKWKSNEYQLVINHLIKSQVTENDHLTENQTSLDGESSDHLTENQTNHHSEPPKEPSDNPIVPLSNSSAAKSSAGKGSPQPPSKNSWKELAAEFDLSRAQVEAFKEWVAYKKEKRQAYKPIGLRKLLKRWGSVPDAIVVEAIDSSIAANYSGLFMPKKKTTASSAGAWETTL